MDYSNFIKELSTKVPDIKKLKDLGYSDREIIEIKDSYIISSCDIEKNSYPELGEFGELISRYEIDKLKIGMISFYKKPKKKDQTFIIGSVETDELRYSMNNGLFYVSPKNDFILWECSDDSEKFLAALLNLADYFSKVAVDEKLYDNQELILEYARISSSLAGGDRFINFYKMILACKL